MAQVPLPIVRLDRQSLSRLHWANFALLSSPFANEKSRIVYDFTKIDTTRTVVGQKGNYPMQNDPPTTPEKTKLTGKQYEEELHKLQIELCKLQEWVKHEGLRIIVLFEGRDAAGKGGVIKAITERVSPRVFRVVALPAPSDREKTQIYLQRYMQYFPAAGEIVIFDRSWYNRAGVEYVMGFCSKGQHERFLQVCPSVEKYIVETGIQLVKYWLEVGNEEQKRRFEARIEDPMRQWKLSAMDLPSRSKWYRVFSCSRSDAESHGYRTGTVVYCALRR